MSPLPILPWVDILGTHVSAINMSDALLTIESMVNRREKGYICVCPVSTVMECQHDEHYRQAVNEARCVTPDGMPTVWLANRRGVKYVSRVYGPDLMLEACRLSSGYKHFFYGATDAVLERLIGNLTNRFPHIHICGYYAPPFRALTSQEERDVISKINGAQPDILWVGLGAPKQDFWMKQYRNVIDAPVMVGVGAAFDFISGAKPQAPRWMQRGGLEWLFRLLSEPQRLWKRYLIGNTLFVYYLIRDAAKRTFVKQ